VARSQRGGTALSESPHALADSLILVFQQPAKCCGNVAIVMQK
jgi:hypothetical protein